MPAATITELGPEDAEHGGRRAGHPNGVAPRLELVGISKRYPGVQANQDVSLDVAPGEIHGVLGENGAGKSTLMKIIYGAVHPDAGELRLDGRVVRIASPRQARALGIAMVFQHFAIFESLTVAENVWLGVDTKLSRAEVVRRVQEVAASYELDPEPGRLVERRVSELSVGERQRVELLRALLGAPRVLILDEPTAVLTPQAAEKVFVTLRRLAAGGCAILYISHKLDEIRALCTRCTVLRAGRVTGVVDPRRETNHSLSELMLGAVPPPLARRAVGSSPGADVAPGLTEPPASPPGGTPAGVERAASSSPVLELRGLTLPRREAFGAALAELRLTLGAGEILGIAGISGSGQRELMDALSGEDARVPPGVLLLGGRDLAGLTVRQRRALGLCFVPEERIGRGTVPGLSLAANTLLTRREAVARGGLLRWVAARRLAARLIRRFGVRTHSPEALAASLSGGNLQKFIMGREIDARPRVLLVAQPTWGLDVGAARQIHRELLALAEAGVAVLVVSEDLEELLELAGDIVVMARGRFSPRVAVRDATIAELGAWMSGLEAGGAAGAANAADVVNAGGGPEPRA
jgi:simple sugar transport system ATP-binding protein